MTPRGAIYFIQVLPAGPVKIGRVRGLRLEPPGLPALDAAVARRLAALSCASPYPLEVRGTIPAEEPVRLEREMHQRFLADRLRGEWFRPSPEMALLVPVAISSEVDPALHALRERLRLLDLSLRSTRGYQAVMRTLLARAADLVPRLEEQLRQPGPLSNGSWGTLPAGSLADALEALQHDCHRAARGLDKDQRALRENGCPPSSR